jgi:acyl carrier protein
MRPAVLIPLDALPLTPNGKVDRNALSAPEQSSRDFSLDGTAPRTVIEELVAQSWREVLKIENLDIYDNFFEVGGHSLFATQIVGRLRDTFDREVPVNALFDAPTVAGLSVQIEKLLRNGTTPALPPIVPVRRDGPLPLSMNQEHLWRLNKMMPGTHVFNMPYVYRLSGDLNISALGKALQEIIRRHEALRTVFTEKNGRPVQIVKDFDELSLAFLDLRAEAPNDLSQVVAGLILDERQRPFDLAGGPLLRTTLLRLADMEYLLLVTMHHIIGDHWSIQIYRRELAALYQAYNEVRSFHLRRPAIQFADYAVWERRLLESGLLEGQLAYWKATLTPLLPKGLLTTTPKRLRKQSVITSMQRIVITDSVLESFRAFAQAQHSTPFMCFISAVTILLYSLTGQKDIRIATLVPNRNCPESHGTIGYFANTVILRTQVRPELTVQKLIKRVGEVIFAAYNHQQLPFEFLARILEARNRKTRGALSNVLVLYDLASFEFSAIPGITIAPLSVRDLTQPVEPLVTAYDLTFLIKETSTELSITVNYGRDILTPPLASKMTHGLTCVVTAMASSLAQRTVGDFVGAINVEL